jgi:hypothetical protein
MTRSEVVQTTLGWALVQRACKSQSQSSHCYALHRNTLTAYPKIGPAWSVATSAKGSKPHEIKKEKMGSKETLEEHSVFCYTGTGTTPHTQLMHGWGAYPIQSPRWS